MKIKIGARSYTKPVPLNEFVIKVTQMSGDADAEDTYTATFDAKTEEEDAGLFIALARAIESAQESGYCRTVKELEQALLPEFKGMFTTDDLRDICGNDLISNGNFLAAVTRVEVYYYDMDGLEYNCTYE
jgi:hypothetical protein